MLVIASVPKLRCRQTSDRPTSPALLFGKGSAWSPARTFLNWEIRVTRGCSSRWEGIAVVLNKQQKERLPSTLARSPEKAQDTYMHTLESAEEKHGDGEAAHRIALASLKHSFEKVGDHWEAKETPGPSDAQDAKRGVAALKSDTPTAGGVDANASKAHLLDLAKRLGVTGRNRMTKAQLVEALDKANRQATARAAPT
jgi:cation transport regulator ChaB